MRKFKNIKEYSELIIEQEANVDGPIHWAASRGQISRLKSMIENGADPNSIGDDHRPPLWRAILSDMDNERKRKTIEILLEAGADANYKAANSGQNSLTISMYCSFDPKTLELLIDAGADVNDRDLADRTPLHHACRNPNTKAELVQVLLERGAKPNEVDQYGETPIMKITGYGHDDPKKIELMAKSGADLNAKFIFNLSMNGDPHSNSSLRAAFENGADANIELEGKSVLSSILKRNFTKDAVKEFLQAGADPFKDAFIGVKDLLNFFDGDLSWWKNAPEEVMNSYERIKKTRSLFKR